MAIGRITGQMLSSTLNRESTNLKFSTTGESNLLFLDATNDRVGIGTATPLYSLDVTGTARVTSNLRVEGNLETVGTTTTIETANVSVEDPLLELNRAGSGGDIDAGIYLNRGEANNAAVFYWNEGTDKFHAVTSNSAASATSVTDTAYQDIVSGGLDIATSSSANALEISQSSGTTTIDAPTSDTDIIFTVNDGGSADTEVFRIDGSESSLLMASGKAIQFADSGESISGDGTDLTIASGGVINLNATSTIAANSKRITSVADPVGDQDAATKAYVTAAISAGADLIEEGDSKVEVVDAGDSTNAIVNIVINNKTVATFAEETDGLANISLGGIDINNNVISTQSNEDIDLQANGTGAVTITSDTGLKIGAGDDLTISVSSDDVTIAQATQDKDIIFTANTGGTPAEVFRVDGSASAVLFASGKELQFADTGEKISGNGTDLTIASGGDIALTATADVNIPQDVGLTFGADTFKVEANGTNLTVNSAGAINLTATSDVVIPANIGLILDGSGDEKIESDGTDITISVGAGGDINIGSAIGLTFGDDGEKIEGDGTDLTISSSNLLNLTATTDVVIPANVGLILDGSGSEKIESDGTDIIISVGANGDVNLPASIGLTFGDDGEKIEGDGTDLTVASSNLLNLTATTVAVSGNMTVSGDLAVSGTTTYIDTTNLLVEDPLIMLNKNNSGGADVDSGIIIERGSAGNNAAFYWNEGEDTFKAVTTASGHDATAITDTALAGIVAGSLTADNLNLDGNTIQATSGNVVFGTALDITGVSITTTSGNGNITLNPDGTGTVDVSSAKITSVADPTSAQDAATKAYVDAQITANTEVEIIQGDSKVEVSDAGDSSAAIVNVVVNNKTVATFAETSDGQGNITLGGIDIDNNTISANTGDIVLGTDIDLSGQRLKTTESNADILLDPSGTGTVNVVGARITNLGTPTQNSDAVTKVYVDDGLAALTSLRIRDEDTLFEIEDGVGTFLAINSTRTLEMRSDIAIDMGASANGMVMPKGNTAARPTAETGLMRFNSETGFIEVCVDGSTFDNLATVQTAAPILKNTATGDGTATSFASFFTSAPADENNVIVVVDNVIQQPDVNYTISGTTLTFDQAPHNGASIYAIVGLDNGSTVSPSFSALSTDLVPAVNNTYDIGSSSKKWKEGFFVTVTATYGDVAERYAADSEITAGTVVQLGGSQEVTVTTEDATDEVFGVVSSRPGFGLNKEMGPDQTHPWIAQVGRVDVKVKGTVNKGDRLIASSTPGVARAATKAECTAFNVIGRALETKTTSSIGLVLTSVKVSH